MTPDAHRAYHEHLLGRMADAPGLNLDLELDLMHPSPTERARPIARCSECPDPTGCELWLDEHRGGSDETPQLCRSKKMLEHLRKGH